MTNGIMGDVVQFLLQNLADHFVIYFIPLYYVGGRPVALLSAQLLGHGAAFLIPVAVLLDTIQIPFFHHFQAAVFKSGWMRRLFAGKREKAQKRQETALFRWGRRLGMPGVIVVAMLPLRGCGMLSAFVLAQLLGLSRLTGYMLLISGSLLGCALVFGLGEILLGFWKMITS